MNVGRCCRSSAQSAPFIVLHHHDPARTFCFAHLQDQLLAPAGNFEKLQTALLYGADAVYLGGESFNLRASCDGFSLDELRQSVALANLQKAKIYYTLNALPMQKDC